MNGVLTGNADVEFESISNLTATTCPDQQMNRYNDTRHPFLPPTNGEILLKKTKIEKMFDIEFHVHRFVV